MSTTKKLNGLLLGLIVLYAIVVSRYWNVLPFWDSWGYIGDFLLPALRAPFNIFNFDDLGHPTMAFHLLLGLPQYISIGNHYILHITVLVLSVISIVIFHRLVKQVFPLISDSVERILITSLYTFFPIIAGNSIAVTPDYGVLVFFIMLISSLLAHNFVMTTIVGFLLVLTKELGFALYIFAILGEMLLIALSPDNISLSKIKEVVYKRIILLVPIFVFFVRIMYYQFVLKSSGLWEGLPQLIADNKIFNFPFLVSYFMGIFVINYNWILTIFMMYTLFMLLLHRKKIESKVSVSSFRYIVYLFVITSITVMTFKHISNLRYMLVIYPLLILLAYSGILTCFRNKLLRIGVLIGLNSIFFITLFYTTDPISRSIYKTFFFGNDMLNMTSITGECCGYGRDQLVYNLQFTHIFNLLNTAISELPVDKNTVLAMSPTGWHFFPPLNIREKKFTLRLQESYTPRYVDSPETLLSTDETIYFFALPNYGNNNEILDKFLYLYSINRVKRYTSGNYWMDVYTLERQSTRLDKN